MPGRGLGPVDARVAGDRRRAHHVQEVAGEGERWLRQRIESRGLLGGEPQRAGAQVVLQLRHRARTEDGARHAGAVHDPAQRDLGRGCTVAGTDLAERIDDREGRFVQVGAVAAHARGAVVLGSVRAVELAREHAAAQGAPRRHAQAELACHRHELALDRALQQRVLDLQRDERHPSLEDRLVLHLGADPRRVVAQAQVANLACTHEHVERVHRLVDRRVRVEEVHPQQVDVVGAKPPQRILDLVHDGLASRAAAVGIAHVHAAAELGGDHQAITEALARPGRKPLAEDRLAVALGVDVGGVDEVPAPPDVALELGDRLLRSGAEAPFGAEGHGAQAERAHAKAGPAERHVVIKSHARTLGARHQRGPIPSHHVEHPRTPAATPPCPGHPTRAAAGRQAARPARAG